MNDDWLFQSKLHPDILFPRNRITRENFYTWFTKRYLGKYLKFSGSFGRFRISFYPYVSLSICLHTLMFSTLYTLLWSSITLSLYLCPDRKKHELRSLNRRILGRWISGHKLLKTYAGPNRSCSKKSILDRNFERSSSAWIGTWWNSCQAVMFGFFSKNSNRDRIGYFWKD